MVRIEVEDNGWIYESPDGGKTIYRRRPGNHYKQLISEQNQTLFNYGEFVRMIEMSEKNPALKKALENLQLIYYTVRDE